MGVYIKKVQASKIEAIFKMLGLDIKDSDIIEVPEPHGRLIDADALIDKLAKAVPYIIMDEVDDAYVQGLNCAYQEVVKAPIIIEYNGDINEVIVNGEKYSKESPNLSVKTRAEEILEIIKNRKE